MSDLPIQPDPTPAAETPASGHPPPGREQSPLELAVVAARRELAAAEAEATSIATPASTSAPCASCGCTAPPDEQGLCPGVPGNKCRRVRKGTALNLIHDGASKLSPVDLATRDALMARLLRERGGRSALDIVTQLRIEDYATAQIQLGKVTRRLELLGAVSSAGNKRSSLVDTYNTFSARVERLAQELPKPVVAAGTSTDDYSSLSTDALVTRLTDLLHAALDLRDGERHASARSQSAEIDRRASNGGGPDHTLALNQSAAPIDLVVPTVDSDVCPYCKRTCVGPDHFAYEVLHYADPVEVKRRDERATKVMLKQMGKSSPW